MIRVLKNPAEVDEAIRLLASRALPLHITPQKNWDHRLLLELLPERDLNIRICDVGSGEGFTIDLLYRLGYRNLVGLEREVGLRAKAHRLAHRMGLAAWAPRCAIEAGDLCDTGLSPDSCDLITCISVVEHGVDIPAFMAEAARIMKPGGALLMTTDYWHDADPEATAGHKIFGLDWTIHNRDSIHGLIGAAESRGLSLLQPGPIPSCDEITVDYEGHRYTFIAIVLTKAAETNTGSPFGEIRRTAPETESEA